MRRTDIVQLVLIIAGIVAGYNAAMLIPDLMFTIYGWFVDGLRLTGLFTTLFSIIVFFIFYSVIAIIAIRRSQQISHYIVNNSGIDSNIKLDQSKKDLLYVLFIGIGCFNLLSRLPVLLKNVFIAFSDKVARQNLDQILHSPYTKNPDFILPVLQVLFSFLLVVFAKQLAEYFASKISNEENLDKIGDEPF